MLLRLLKLTTFFFFFSYRENLNKTSCVVVVTYSHYSSVHEFSWIFFVPFLAWRKSINLMVTSFIHRSSCIVILVSYSGVGCIPLFHCTGIRRYFKYMHMKDREKLLRINTVLMCRVQKTESSIKQQANPGK